MITNMRNIIEQAAYEAGRALAKYEMLVETSGMGIQLPQPGDYARDNTPASRKDGNGTRKRRVAAPKAAAATKEPKAPVIARGVRKAAGPRTKGVKEAMIAMMERNPDGVTIINFTGLLGFKETSVRATLMGLKKAGIAFQDDEKRWFLTVASTSGNGGDTAAHADF